MTGERVMVKKARKTKLVKAKKRFFSVKTYFIQEVSGKGKKSSGLKGDMKKAIGLEERVIIYQAKDFLAATKLALMDAKKYQKKSYVNQFGDKVRGTFTGHYSAVELIGVTPKVGLAFGILDVFLSRQKLLKALKARHYPQRDNFIEIMSKKFSAR